MNNWHLETMAEHDRQQILVDAEHIHRGKITLQSRVYRPRFLAQTMFHFANWMISTGRQLRKRYEVPTVQCCNSPAGSLSH